MRHSSASTVCYRKWLGASHTARSGLKNSRPGPSDLVSLVPDGLLQGFEFLLDPLVSFGLGGELATATLLGIQLRALLLLQA